MGEVRLNTPRLLVVREQQDDLEVQAINADLVRWDRTRFKHHWPTGQDAPFLFLTFIAWSAARRTGAIPGSTTYETWEAEVLEVKPMDDEEEDDQGRPTQRDLDPD